MGFAASYYTMLYYAILLYILHSNLLAYTYHFEQEALLGSTPGSYNTSSPLSFMYSALPKDYGECMVSKIGSIRVLVLKFCIIKSSSSQIHKQCVAYYYSRLQLYCQILGQWLQSWWQLSRTITSTLSVITSNLTGGVRLSRLQT